MKIDIKRIMNKRELKVESLKLKVKSKMLVVKNHQQITSDR